MQKVAIVTGSASGLGLKTVILLLSKNFLVFGWDMKTTPLDSPSLKSQIVDVSDTKSISSALSTVLQSTSKIDVLVNAAGILMLIPTISRSSVHSLAAFEKVLKINLIGTFYVTRQVSMHMNGGVVVLVSSINAYQGFKFLAAYEASKGGIASLAMPMSRDLASRGTRVVSISPGAFETPMTQLIRPEIKDNTQNVMASGRFGKPEEFAHAVWFVIENDYLNGCSLDLNGGLVNPNI
jgi:NAD(P)-dependent dehydrogenase (short-subunit alcohol dehydrogenase family)